MSEASKKAKTANKVIERITYKKSNGDKLEVSDSAIKTIIGGVATGVVAILTAVLANKK
jgi:hypothetical protein